MHALVPDPQLAHDHGDAGIARVDHERFEPSERRPSGQRVVHRDDARSRDPAEEAARDAERGLWHQVTIEVMPMRRPPPGAEPNAGVVHPDARRRKAGDDASQLGRRVKGNSAVRSEARANSRRIHPATKARSWLPGTKITRPGPSVLPISRRIGSATPPSRARTAVLPQTRSQMKVREHDCRHATSQ